MQPVIQEFEAKVQEIDIYFKFLDHVHEHGTSLYFPNKKTHQKKPVNDELLKIFKASSFLIMYNLVESTIRLSVDQIYEHIKMESFSYKDLRNELRELWVRDQLFDLERGHANHSSYRNAAKKIVEEALESLTAEFRSERLPISGNLDAASIRDLAAKFGFSSKVHNRAKGGSKLQIVKDMRNNLAHGSLSFSECGREFDETQLKEIKREIIIYLRHMIKNVDRYIEKRVYANILDDI